MRLKVCAVSELEKCKAFETEKLEGIVLQCEDGIYACQRYCPHKEFPLDFGRILDPHTLHCTCHGSKFDLTSGKVLEPPAETELTLYPVEIDGDDIYVEIPD